jgi:hypothetical protein
MRCPIDTDRKTAHDGATAPREFPPDLTCKSTSDRIAPTGTDDPNRWLP